MKNASAPVMLEGPLAPIYSDMQTTEIIAAEKLTEKRHEIMAYVAHGYRSKEIAAALGMNDNTVRSTIAKSRKILRRNLSAGLEAA